MSCGGPEGPPLHPRSESKVGDKGRSQRSESKVGVEGRSQRSESKVGVKGRSRRSESKVGVKGRSQRSESKVGVKGRTWGQIRGRRVSESRDQNSGGLGWVAGKTVP